LTSEYPAGQDGAPSGTSDTDATIDHDGDRLQRIELEALVGPPNAVSAQAGISKPPADRRTRPIGPFRRFERCGRYRRPRNTGALRGRTTGFEK